MRFGPQQEEEEQEEEEKERDFFSPVAINLWHTPLHPNPQRRLCFLIIHVLIDISLKSHQLYKVVLPADALVTLHHIPKVLPTSKHLLFN